MRCETTSDPHAFWERASDFLLSDPVLNGVIVTTVEARRARAITDPVPATYAAVLGDGGRVVGAAMRTPPLDVYVSPMPADAVSSLVEAMLEACPDVIGVTGTAAEAEAFASAWARRTGVTLAMDQRQRIHRLDAVTAPAAVPGSWRVAESPDHELLVEWMEAFGHETGSLGAPGVARQVDLRLAEGRAFLLMDGVPVSFVGTSARAGGGVRV